MARDAKRIAWLFVAVLGCGLATSAFTDDELKSAPSWQVANPEAVAADALAWMDQQNADAAVRQQAQELWSATALEEGNLDLLERTAATIALVEPRAGSVLELARRGASPSDEAAQLQWLDAETTSPFVRNNLRLLFGRSLVQGLYFDEALQTLDGLKPNDVVDPAALLFARGVAHHRLIHKNEGLEAVEKLLENEDAIPRRYAVLAKLMRADLSQIKDGSLDDVSRRMQDVERRLGHGRANQKVRDVEDEVIAMLDKLIEEEEKKQQQQSGGGGASGGSQSSRPAPDSLPLGGKGPGQVTKRNIGNSAGWGDLPPKQREEAMQEIGRDFPAHYREVIEEYFREIAKQR